MANDTAQHIVIIAGEASGDMHAAHLVRALRARDPRLRFSGLGGQDMRRAGVDIYEDLTRLAVVGFVEVLRHYREIKRIFDLILAKILDIRPAAVILVDYPGFNLRLAKILKRHGIKVIYYISPQVWAWKKNRVYQIQRDVDLMLVLFPFEKDFYARYQIDVSFVGHPLVDTVRSDTARDEVLSRAGLDPARPTIGLLPGSRRKEIDTLLPVMLKTAEILRTENPDRQFLLIQAPTVETAWLTPLLEKTPLEIKVRAGDIYNGIHACDACLVASGTATLETAILERPMVVIYKTAWITWLLAKLFVKIPDIGLVNIVAGKRIVPECVQGQATPKRIARALQTVTADPELITANLRKVTAALGAPGASRRAAEAILNAIG